MTATETEVDDAVDDRPDETEEALEGTVLERLAQHVFFAGDRLVIDDPDLVKARLVRERWSPSSALSLSDGCPSKWAIEKLLPRSADPFGAAEMGTSGHWVLETLFGMPAAQRTLEAAISIIESISPEANPDLAVPTEAAPRFMWGAEVLGKIAGLWQTEDPKRVYAVGLEKRLDNVSIGGVPFIGIVDRTSLVTTVEGRTGLKVEDYKTGGLPRNRSKALHHADQTRLYDLAYTDLHGEAPVAASIIYTAHGQVSEITLPKVELDRVEAMFVDTYNQAARRAERGEYETLLSGLCGWCPLTTVCPTAKSGGRSAARVPGAKAGTEIGIRVLPAIVAVPSLADPDLDLGVLAEPPLDPDYDAAPPPDARPATEVAYQDAQAPVFSRTQEPPPDRSTEPEPVEVDDFGIPISVPAPTSQVAEAPSRKKEEEMADNWSGGEGKTWELTLPDGSPNPNSFAASGVFGMVDEATKAIQGAGYKATANMVLVVSQTLMSIVDKAMRSVTGTHTAGLNDGLHTRLRGALYSFVEANPMPMGQPVEAWDAWAAQAVTRISGVAKVSFYLMTQSLPERPWAADVAAPLFLPAAPAATDAAAAA